jgi:hypothetical protein
MFFIDFKNFFIFLFSYKKETVMTKNPTFGFQYFLDRTIPAWNDGLKIAKKIILSFPNHIPEEDLKGKSRDALIKIIVDYCFNNTTDIDNLNEKVRNATTAYNNDLIQDLDRQYPNFNSDCQQAIARSDKTEMLQSSNQTWLKKIEEIY